MPTMSLLQFKSDTLFFKVTQRGHWRQEKVACFEAHVPQHHVHTAHTTYAQHTPLFHLGLVTADQVHHGPDRVWRMSSLHSPTHSPPRKQPQNSHSASHVNPAPMMWHACGERVGCARVVCVTSYCGVSLLNCNRLCCRACVSL